MVNRALKRMFLVWILVILTSCTTGVGSSEKSTSNDDARALSDQEMKASIPFFCSTAQELTSSPSFQKLSNEEKEQSILRSVSNKSHPKATKELFDDRAAFLRAFNTNDLHSAVQKASSLFLRTPWNCSSMLYGSSEARAFTALCSATETLKETVYESKQGMARVKAIMEDLEKAVNEPQAKALARDFAKLGSDAPSSDATYQIMQQVYRSDLGQEWSCPKLKTLLHNKP